MNHTACPWIIDKERPTYPQADRPIGYYVANLKSGGRIAQFFENCLVTTEAEALANAQLFLAAPNLLKALQDLTAQMDALIASGDCGRSPILPIYLYAARAAIAASEGIEL